MARIAVVEDYELVLELITEVLTGRGHEVLAYQDASSAYEALVETRPDLLITDIELPDGNGLDLVGRLHKIYPELPVLVQSGRGGETDLLAGFEAGASDYITKPVALPELLAKCSVLLARAKKSTEEQAPRSGQDLPGGVAKAFGRYRIDSILGEGGGGTVYSAWDLNEGREVALKVLPSLLGLREESRQRFVRETYALSSIRNPQVVGVLDFGTQEGRSYYAMTRVHGQTLEERIEESGPASAAELVTLLTQLAHALGAVHGAGLVHRDLKPSNVVLRGDDYADPVLVDFGLAKRPEDHTLTRTGAIVGTPAYLSPEQIQGKSSDARSDLFSLGLLALYGFTGKQLYPDNTLLELLRDLSTQPVEVPSDMGEALGGVVQRLTRLNPKDRFSSTRELLEALANIDP